VPDRGPGFLDPCRFPFVALLEAQRAAICADFAELPPERFEPWLLADAYQGDWRLFGIWHRRADYVLRGHLDANERFCRRTRAIVRRIRGLLAAGFSRLGPGSHVLPHVDEQVVPSLRCHLTVAADPGARMRVGDEVRLFEPGGILVFDSGVEHEVVHEGREPRVTLIVEVERAQAELPPLGADESRASAAGETSSALPKSLREPFDSTRWGK
jgi:aspartyl/asparaginyl beta-hydroxylase